MTITRKLFNHPGCNCHVEINPINGDISFFSYATRVITLTKDKRGGRLVECTGTYSVTTARQIGYFLREYAPDLNYYDIKRIVGKGFILI